MDVGDRSIMIVNESLVVSVYDTSSFPIYLLGGLLRVLRQIESFPRFKSLRSAH
jgi:hypothetical protein